MSELKVINYRNNFTEVENLLDHATAGVNCWGTRMVESEGQSIPLHHLASEVFKGALLHEKLQDLSPDQRAAGLYAVDKILEFYDTTDDVMSNPITDILKCIQDLFNYYIRGEYDSPMGVGFYFQSYSAPKFLETFGPLPENATTIFHHPHYAGHSVEWSGQGQQLYIMVSEEAIQEMVSK